VRRRPQILEVNAWPWLDGVRARHGRRLELGDVPESELRELVRAPGLDAVWLMGVWERSPASARIARAEPGVVRACREALADFAPRDVVGSPYAVRRYAVDPRLGGAEALATLRGRLRDLGLGLILDFVPNHVARDHDWTRLADHVVRGTREDLARHPGAFFRGGRSVVAHGRDPHFPAWTDTAQVDAFSEALRAAASATLLEIASQCDGVRCDMAMLVTNAVFSRTWGERVGPAPATEYWETVMAPVRRSHPGFLFLAEVYWDLEAELQRQGFDHCYDKRLYDRLLGGDAAALREHLEAPTSYQEGMLRFVENHDETRAMAAFGRNRSWMAAVLVATLPGAKLWHEGQFRGHTVRLPVQLGRRPPESDDGVLERFYELLLWEASHPVYREGRWLLRGPVAAALAEDGDGSFGRLVSYSLQHGEERRLVVVNYSAGWAGGRIPLPDLGLEGRSWRLRDALSNKEHDRDGDEMAGTGLQVVLAPWSSHLFDFRPVPAPD
jgi:Alpha amylase, catalytic domain